MKGNKKKYITIFLVCFTSISFGLADFDYFWQCILGGSYLHGNGFYSANLLTWGTIGKETYLDHEWLSNIIFYLYSCLGDYGAFLLKLIICALVGVVTIYFIRGFKNSIKGVKFYMFLCYLVVIAGVLYKIKPYMFSVYFLMLEIMMLYDYEERKDLKRSLIWSVLIVIFWNNMHSGSIPLFFVVMVMFFVVRDISKKAVALFLVDALATMVNPYGYKLFLFDLQHNSEKVMKIYNMDWQPIDTKNLQSMLLAGVVILILAIVLVSKGKKDKFGILGFCAILFLSMGSARHLIYLLPFVIILLDGSELDLRESKTSENFCLIVALSIFILNVGDVVLSRNFASDYLCVPDDTDLHDSLVEVVRDEGNDGLFMDANCNFVYYWGIQPFYSGAYPEAPSRWNDSYFMQYYASPQQISQIIDYYGLDKFLVTKYSEYEGYLATSTLYNYLVDNPEYTGVYDGDYYALFVKK